MTNITNGAQVFKGEKLFGTIEKIEDHTTFYIKMKPGNVFKETETFIIILPDDKLELIVETSKTNEHFLIKAVVLESNSVLYPRQHKRIELTLYVNVDKKESIGTSIDISEGGMKFLLDKAIVKDKIVNLKFEINNCSFDIKGKIVGLKRVTDGFRYNAQFFDLPEETLAALRASLYKN